MSEVGSLSVEFTRLAQITKEPRYYDAVARITNAFEEWQNQTRLPGMWPLAIDASGCRKVSSSGYGKPAATVDMPAQNGKFLVMHHWIDTGW